MSRPAVSVVMPFAGSRAAAQQALDALLGLDARADDELILADNSGVADGRDPVLVVPAVGEQSPSHARNVGAEHASRDWVLFLDADCSAAPGLIAGYFAEPIESDVGALAGEVVPSDDGATFAARYGAARSFLGQRAHLAHSYLPRAVAANLLVRRVAFDEVGGFYEGVRAAEDTDFSWRLQQAGWRLEPRPQARVAHRYRTTVGGLRRQWRGYAAGRAWLGRRYEDFEPQPALRRAGARALRTVTGRRGRLPPRPARPRPGAAPGRLDKGRFLALDALLGVDELAGLALSNRPGSRRGRDDPARVVMVADRFPARGDPLGDFALTLAGARVEAAARPAAVEQEVARAMPIDYREDDGAAARAVALVRVILRHPLRSARDFLARDAAQPPLSALAPAVVRLVGDRDARVHSLGGEEATAVARRLARLTGRPLQDPEP
ncbi:MAG TPA: glycosyltransferase family 2 protein [Solirubrobacteraceae bacterium]